MNLRLHSFWRSSSAWRVRIGLGLKGLAFSYETVDLGAGQQNLPEHRARSPFGHVPVLEVAESGERLVLLESMAILHYLEERFPEPPLLPKDLPGRARVRALAEHVNSAIQPLQNSVVQRFLRERGPGLETAFARRFNRDGLAALEVALQDGLSGRFCHGDTAGLADCYLVPQLGAARRLDVDVSPYPTLLRIEEACNALPAFEAARPERQPDAPAH